MLTKGYLYGSHYLPHDALATMNSGKTFLTELGEVGLRNCKGRPENARHLDRHQSPASDSPEIHLQDTCLRTWT